MPSPAIPGPAISAGAGPSADPAGPAFTHCRVCDGLAEIRYRHAGQGDPVVVLASPTWACAPAMLAALAGRFRVIVPSSPAPGIDRAVGCTPSDWLRSFLDGLGIGRVTLVADETSGAAALGFALLEDERVERLAIVLPGAPAGPAVEPVESALPGAGTRVLVSWLHEDHAAAARDLARRLRGMPATD